MNYRVLGDTEVVLTFLDGKKKYEMRVSKTINLNTVERPCYEGEDYNDQEYLQLAEIIREDRKNYNEICFNRTFPK